MYRVLKFTKKIDLSVFDYVFKSFDEFYDVTCYIKYPLFGVYKIAIITNIVDDTIKFVDNEDSYFHLDISIFMEDAQIEHVMSVRPELKTEESSGAYDIWKNMIGERELLFDKYMTYKLYQSIEHDTTSMVEAIDLVKHEYPESGELITEDKLRKLFVLDDTIYPRQVLMKFLGMERNRWKLLKMCMKQIDSGVITGATSNNIKKLLVAKATYLKTGEGIEYIKRIPTRNLLTAYKTFCTKRFGFDDPYVLYVLYENGLSVEEVRGGANVSI